MITTDRCGLADSIQQNALGAVVKFGDVTGLKDEIVRALSNPADAQLSERRRNYVLANFSWEAIAEQWERIYRDCAIKQTG